MAGTRKWNCNAHPLPRADGGTMVLGAHGATLYLRKDRAGVYLAKLDTLRGAVHPTRAEVRGDARKIRRALCYFHANGTLPTKKGRKR